MKATAGFPSAAQMAALAADMGDGEMAAALLDISAELAAEMPGTEADAYVRLCVGGWTEEDTVH